MKTIARTWPHLALALPLSLLVAPALPQSGVTTLVSRGAGGLQGNQTANYLSISGDGRYVAFVSESTNLVPGDVNGVEDVFVHDRVGGATTLESKSTLGVQGDGRSRYPSLSADGSRMAFVSLADNLVPGDTNPSVDVYVRDLVAGTTVRVSVSSTGAQANQYSTRPSLASDGSCVSYFSYASNLVPGDTNDVTDIFVHELATGATTRVSLAWNGGQSDGASFLSSLSSDGRYVAFESLATNLVPGDVNGKQDVFVRDRVAGTTEVVSVSSAGVLGDRESGEPWISGDGRFVVYRSLATNLVPGDTNAIDDVFLHDRLSGTTTRVSVGPGGLQSDGPSRDPALSSDGRWVVHSSRGTTLVPGDANGSEDAFVYDRLSALTTLLSVSSAGVQADQGSYHARIDADGSVGIFSTSSSNLVPGDVGGVVDAFARDLAPCALPGRYCQAKTSSNGCVPSLAWSGSPTLGGPDDFHVTAAGLLNQHVGLLIWGLGGQAVPFQGGLLCVASPVRTSGQSSGGTPPPAVDCSGSFDQHFDQALMAAYALQPGELVFAQFWSRDSGFAPPDNVGLTEGLQFRLCP